MGEHGPPRTLEWSRLKRVSTTLRGLGGVLGRAGSTRREWVCEGWEYECPRLRAPDLIETTLLTDSCVVSASLTVDG
jgi:hypothetical protein